MAIHHSAVLDTALITAIRAACFYSCAFHVLRSVYHDLKSLTSTASNRFASDDDEELELDSLPAPSTASGASIVAPVIPTLRNQDNRAVKSKPGPEHAGISRLCFSLCFSESCTLLFLVICQEVHIFEAESRMLNWRISLFVVLLMILFVIPLAQNYLLTYQSPLGHLSRKRSFTSRIAMAIVPYSLYLIAFSYIPLPESLSGESASLTAISLARLVVFGTFIMGLLSGFGAMRNSWEFMPVISNSRRRKIPTEQEICASEAALEGIRKDLVLRRADEKRLQSMKASESSSWVSRMKNSVTGNSELASIQQEVTGLEALDYQIERNLEEMKNRYASSRYNRTLQGRVLQWTGRLFAVYCAFRTLSCFLNILAPFHSTPPDPSNEESQSSYTDLIAHFLTYLVSLLPFIHLSAERISAISRQVSLGLVGIIILSSVRFVLRAVSRILKITSQNLGASLLLLILAQLMGTYLLSTLVQLRTAFPPKNDDASNVFSALPAYEVFGAAFDYSYLLSALATAAYLWFDERINSGGGKFDDT